MPKTASTTTDYDEYSTYSTGTILPPAEPPSSSDNSSFMRSRFDSLVGFHRWLAKDGRSHQAPANKTAACPGTAAGSGEARQKTYLLEDMSWSPLNRWRNLVREDDEGPQQTKKCRRGCCGGGGGVRGVGCCYRRKRSSSRERDVYVSPKYFEPWIWKGTTRKPPHRYVPDSVDEGGEGGDGNLFTYFIVIAIVVFVLVILVKNRDRMQNLVKFGGRYLGTSDFSSVKVSVEGGVKDMIGTNFDDMSWKYEDPQETDDDQSFESAIEENDPSVIKHIRNFEEQLKKKPSMFFPSGGGGESGRGKKTSSFLNSMRNQMQ